MIDQKYIDLMNQELDGTNTPDQSRELEAHLRDNPQARDYYRELALAMNLFDKVAMVDPPPGLTATILEQAAHGTGQTVPGPAEPESVGWWAACRALFHGKPRLSHTVTFATGLACGLLLLTGSSWLDNRHGTDLNGQVQGTASVRAWDLDQVTEGQWHDPAVQGTYRTRQEGRALDLQLKIQADRPTVVRFSHGPETSLQRYDADNPVPARLVVTESRVEVSLDGQGSYEFEFHGTGENASLIEMSVFTEGRLVFTEDLN